MKKLLSLSLLCFYSILSIGQISSVDYVIEINNTTGHYDCKVVMLESDVLSYQDRIIDACKFTVIVPTGTPVTFVESFSPYIDNENQNSTTPVDWILTSTDIAPAEQPESDYYQFTLDANGLTASFNDFMIDDVLTLFSIDVETDCNLEVRRLHGDFDATTIASTDYSHEIIQNGNSAFFFYSTLPSTAVEDFEIAESTYQNCIDGCVTITPEIICGPGILFYQWDTGENTESITVCPTSNQVYNVTVTGPDVFPNFIEQSTSVSVFIDTDIIYFDDVDFFCVGNSYIAISEFGYANWSSSDISIASFDNDELFINAEGTVTISNTSPAGCITELEITTSTGPPVLFTGPTEICQGQTTALSPSAGVTWTTDNAAVATINNSGLVTGISQGTTFPTVINTATGCSTTSDTPITVLAAPFIQNNGPDELCIGETTQMAAAEDGTWQTSDPSIATITNTGLITGTSPGEVSVSFTSIEQGCSSTYETITVHPLPIITSGTSNICIGETTSLSPSAGGTWVSNDPAIATINNTGVATGVSEGTVQFYFTDDATGCISDVSTTTLVQDCNAPCDEDAETNWVYAPAGSFTEDFNIITYSTASNLLDDGGLDHLVFYDYNSGNVFLKVNNQNGILDEEILLFQNPDHYGNGEYKMYLEDIDNDGLTDIILAEYNIVGQLDIGDRLSIYQNLGNGEFVRKINEQVCGMAGPDNLIIKDFDNDGMKDIYFICLDYIHGILYVNNWNSVDQMLFDVQSFTFAYSGDFNNDGFADISNDNGEALINNGDRTFNEISFIQYENVSPSYYYYIDEVDILVDHAFTFSIESQGNNFDFENCSYFQGGDYENETFRANINSPSEEVVLIPQVAGFQYFDTNLECSTITDPLQVSNVVARHNTKIDLTLNGCTDFLVIDGNDIFAWINPKESNKILGEAYIDSNANGTFDAGEQPLRNVLINITPGNISILTDNSGNYVLSVPEGEYTLTATVNEGEWVENQLTITDVAINEPCNEGYNFGFVPAPVPTEMATLSMVNSIARCDFETRFSITVENTGSEPLDGVLAFSFDDMTTFFSTEINDYVLDDNTLITDIGPLAPFAPVTYKITVKMPSGSANLPMLDFEAKLFNKFGEVIQEIGYADQLRCSYDPNDKRTYPDREGEENLTLMEEDLEYTIRFQNNGNDTAFLVKIVDPLDPNIEQSSIRVMNASHPVETCIENDNLIFLFEDILLVDSTTNYDASQGFVTFRCNVIDGLPDMTPVYNQADIIFDSNEPIVTNQTINTLVTFLCTDKETMIEASICEGDTYQGYEQSGTYTEVFELPLDCDSIVTIVLDVQQITYAQQNIQTCEGDQINIDGVSYLITENTAIIDTTFNTGGCISSIITYQVDVLSDLLGMPDDINLCLGETFTFDIPINGNWVTNDPSVVSIDEEGTFTVIGAGSTSLTFTDAQLGCTDDLMITVHPDPVINNTGADQICINDSTLLVADDVGTWISSDTSISSINNNGVAYGLTEGTAELIFTDSVTGCSNFLSIAVLPADDPMCMVSNTVDAEEAQIKLYPNPTSESLFIETNQQWNTILLLDTQGKIVSSIEPVAVGPLELNVSEFSSGVYIIVFQNGAQKRVKRFIVE